MIKILWISSRRGTGVGTSCTPGARPAEIACRGRPKVRRGRANFYNRTMLARIIKTQRRTARPENGSPPKSATTPAHRRFNRPFSRLCTAGQLATCRSQQTCARSEQHQGKRSANVGQTGFLTGCAQSPTFDSGATPQGSQRFARSSTFVGVLCESHWRTNRQWHPLFLLASSFCS